MYSIIPDWRNIKPLGRTWQMTDSLWLAMSGSGAEFTFTGSLCRVTITGDDWAIDADQANNHARIAIYVDGVRVVDAMMDTADKTFTVVDGALGEHTIRIVKLSESAMSTCGVKAIEADGEIRLTARKARYIEFIGDSITCGYGVDDEDSEHHFLTVTEDATRAYAYQTAQMLDADYSLVSLSGYGIISGYTDTAEEAVTNQLMPTYYDKLGFSYASYQGQKPEDIRWDFAARQPDVVVINLGTNDDSYCRDDVVRQEYFCSEYEKFLQRVRVCNTSAKIICTLGMMGDRLYPFVEKAAAEYMAQSGDTNIACMHFIPQLDEDGRAADYHPTETTHSKAAKKLAAHISQLMGW